MCTITKKPFGDAFLITLCNNFIELDITNFGGIIVSIRVPDIHGKKKDIVLGYDTLEEYKKDKNYFGGIIGRVANRIAGGRFSLNSKTYQLQQNNGPNSLHGGEIGFHQVYWEIKKLATHKDYCELELFYFSKDGESGYPGNLAITATYVLTLDGEIQLNFSGKTDQDTIINLTNHTYWNLSGGTEDVLETLVKMESSRFIPVNQDLIPLGTLDSVMDTPFDFQIPQTIGSKIHDNHPQLIIGKGYDHSFFLDTYEHNSKDRKLACTITHKALPGIQLQINTTQAAVQFYSGNFLSSVRGKRGQVYDKHYGFCMETQFFPDSINHSHFPSILLKPGQVYAHSLSFKLLKLPSINKL